jgi:hypothetical protein
VRTGDFIELDVPRRRVHLDISDAELAARMSSWQRPAPPLGSGYWKLYVDTVLQADQGADLSFLAGKRGSFVPRPDEPDPKARTTRSARSFRATTTEASAPHSRGRAAADDSREGRALQALPEFSDPVVVPCVR